VTLGYPAGFRPVVQRVSGGQPVALYLLRDLRQQPGDPEVWSERYLGFVIYNDFEGTGLPLYAKEAVAVVVTRELAEGLKARGFPIVDSTQRAFQAGDGGEGARLALLGEVQRFGFPRAGAARCDLRLEIREIESGKKVWDKSFSSLVPLPTRPALNLGAVLGAVNDALSRTVDDAVMDRELTDLLGGH
jgi:hypothetical protein